MMCKNQLEKRSLGRIKTLNEDDAFYNLLLFFYILQKKTDEVHICQRQPKVMETVTQMHNTYVNITVCSDMHM